MVYPVQNFSNDKRFLQLRSSDFVRARLFCFPYAGGTPQVFSRWVNYLPKDVELIAIRLPGRENLIGVPPYQDWETLLFDIEELIIPFLDKPYALFGHSFGGRIVFEMGLRLQRQRLACPEHVYISGCSSPENPCQRPYLHELSEQEFKQKLLTMAGTPEEILKNKALMKLLEPTIRADMRLSELWRFSGEEKLNVPLTIFCGLQDEIDPPAKMDSWRKYTSRKFSCHLFNGGHFFLNHFQSQLAHIVVSDLPVAEFIHV